MRARTLRPIARRALAAQSDERLVGLVRDGHDPAFEEIVRRYRGPLVAFATAIVSHHRAEDVVQVSLTKAHRVLLEAEKEINLRPWLFTIVRNGSLNVIRDEPISDEIAPDFAGGASPEAIAEQHDELDRLVLAICALPSPQREALVRRELDGAGHADIAAQLGTSATAVRGLIFRARTTLRDAVGALVPLPLMRHLLLEAPQAGAATGAAGVGAAASAGAGTAAIGAAGAKGGMALAAAVLALATGVAIERGRGDRDPARAEAAQFRSEGSAKDSAPQAENAITSATAEPESIVEEPTQARGEGGGDDSELRSSALESSEEDPAEFDPGRDSGSSGSGSGSSGSGSGDESAPIGDGGGSSGHGPGPSQGGSSSGGSGGHDGSAPPSSGGSGSGGGQGLPAAPPPPPPPPAGASGGQYPGGHSGPGHDGSGSQQYPPRDNSGSGSDGGYDGDHSAFPDRDFSLIG